MQLPWKKKNKITRISQIVADFQTPKRGGSLVVETGFPTSLIDLIVKNRSRFRKRNSKKHQPFEISDSQPLLPAPPPSPSSLATSMKVSPVRFVDETIREGIIHEGANSGFGSIPLGECIEVVDRMLPTTAPLSNSTNMESVSVEMKDSEDRPVQKDVGEHVNGVSRSGRVLDRVWKSKPNMVLATILNMVAMVVLILWVQKLTVGTILTAFALLFFEFVGNRAASCFNLKPWLSTNKESRSLISKVTYSFWFQAKKKNYYLVSEQKSVVLQGTANELCSASSSIAEIEVVQDTDSAIDISCELNSAHRDQKLVCPEIEEDDRCEISEGRRKGKPKADELKLKSKLMKIFLPKKMIVRKKEKKGKTKSKSEVFISSMEGLKSATIGIKDQVNMIQRSQLLSVEEDEGNKKADSGTTCSIAIESGGRTDTSTRNSECTVLILITLCGLVGGRTIAVLATMAACFIIKMVKNTGSDKTS